MSTESHLTETITSDRSLAAPSKCVVLVPVGSITEPDCERALHVLERRGYQVRRAYGYSAIDFGRSALASQALRDGFDELMWIDSDVGFRPDDVERLRRLDLPISCGLYPKKDRKSFACHFIPGTERVVFGKGGGMREVLYAGFGFMHTRREVYERIKDRIGLPECNQRFGPTVTPWFLPEYVPDGAGWWYLAEDYAFCNRARRCGYRIMADTTIRLVHIGRHRYCWEDFGDKPSRYKTLEIRFGAGAGAAAKGGAAKPAAEPTPPAADVVPGPPPPEPPGDASGEEVVEIDRE